MDSISDTYLAAWIIMDMGLKELATYSTGETIEAKAFYRNAEEQLAIAQRANKKKRAKAIHAKIANRRKDHHHQLSIALVKCYAAIFNTDMTRFNVGIIEHFVINKKDDKLMY